jgi:hypothetical protein
MIKKKKMPHDGKHDMTNKTLDSEGFTITDS